MQKLQPLLEVMIQEKDIYRNLLELSVQKRVVLIQNDVPALEGIVQREKGLVQTTRELETQRQKLMDGIAADLDIGSEDTTLTRVVEVCEEPLKGEFISLKEELRGVVAELSQSNDTNKKLIQTHLDYTSFCIRLLTDAGEGQTYNNKGATNEEGSNKYRVFDARI